MVEPEISGLVTKSDKNTLNLNQHHYLEISDLLGSLFYGEVVKININNPSVGEMIFDVLDRSESCSNSNSINYKLNLNNLEIKNNESIFKINYNSEDKYYLTGIAKNNLSLFIKVNQPYTLKETTVISLGSTFIMIKFENESKTVFFDIYSTGQFSMSVSNQNIIKIGTGKDCNVKLLDKSVDEMNSILTFNQETNYWEVSDNLETPSRCGTWVKLNRSYPLIENTICRVYESIFLIVIKSK